MSFEFNIMQSEISVTIYTLESIVYQGKVKAVTSLNEKGKFDILPLHSNFISVVKDYLVLNERQGTKKEFKFKRGVLRVVDNNLSIFLGLEGLQE